MTCIFCILKVNDFLFFIYMHIRVMVAILFRHLIAAMTFALCLCNVVSGIFSIGVF